MFSNHFYERFNVDERITEQIGFNPYNLNIGSGLNEKIYIEGQPMIDLASNNYLGLATDQRVKKSVISAVNQYGVSLCGTPIATGSIDIYKRIESKLSQFIGLEETVLFPSCYQANNGLFASIATKEDLIIVDRLAHSSLIQGIQAVGCKIKPFIHNDLKNLKDNLKQSHHYKQVFVVTESVFSTTGDITPFKEITALCHQYNALPIVDDSHGIGVLGKSGKGILEEQNITDYKGIYTASLGKAFANAGGMISGERKIIDYLKYYCPHLVYSTTLTPGTLAGIEAVLEIIGSEFGKIKKKLYRNKKIILESLQSLEWDISSSRTPINSIKTKSRENTIQLAKKMYNNGIFSTPFIEPSVPVNEGCIRLIAGAHLSESVLIKTGEILKRIKNT